MFTISSEYMSQSGILRKFETSLFTAYRRLCALSKKKQPTVCKAELEMHAQKKSPQFWSEEETHLVFKHCERLGI